MKPCPFCGTDRPRVIPLPGIPNVPNAARVECGFCGALGPASLSPSCAEEAWDARKPSPAGPRRPKYVPSIDHDEDLNP